MTPADEPRFGQTPDPSQTVKMRRRGAGILAWLRARAAMPVDLEWFSGWRDLILALGAAAIEHGVFMIYKPAGWITLGAGLIYYSLLVGSSPKK